MSEHYASLDEDAEGWAFTVCDGCGWRSPPCPDPETAFGFHTDHVLTTERDPRAKPSTAKTQHYDGTVRAPQQG